MAEGKNEWVKERKNEWNNIRINEWKSEGKEGRKEKWRSE